MMVVNHTNHPYAMGIFTSVEQYKKPARTGQIGHAATLKSLLSAYLL